MCLMDAKPIEWYTVFYIVRCTIKERDGNVMKVTFCFRAVSTPWVNEVLTWNGHIRSNQSLQCVHVHLRMCFCEMYACSLFAFELT